MAATLRATSWLRTVGKKRRPELREIGIAAGDDVREHLVGRGRDWIVVVWPAAWDMCAGRFGARRR
ncbi:hypothetical protein [Actinoplanes sp. NPDC051411]|uniref:hypothetical protein n=1 Tax=Actinoplanes sp. NPDC051411 TaxID=3155522 RepID=UPI0034392C1F